MRVGRKQIRPMLPRVTSLEHQTKRQETTSAGIKWDALAKSV